MIIWIARAVVVATLLALGGFAIDRVTAAYRVPRRWTWVAVLALSLALPFFGPRIGSILPARVMAPVVSALQPGAPATSVSTIVLNPQAAATSSVRSLFDADAAARRAWLGGSLLMLAMFTAAYVRLRRVRARAERRDIDGVAVRVVAGTGPAVIGVVHPEIVIPHWVTEADAAERRMILTHEQEHISAHDQLLLAFGTLALIAMPWNVALWWQHLVLRRAIETDCDARVLSRGADRRSYAAALIRTAGTAPAYSLLAPAWREQAADLRHRILAMTARPPRARVLRTGAFTLVAAALVLGACETMAPTQPAVLGQAPTAKLAFDFTEPGMVRVNGYTREHLRARLVITEGGGFLMPTNGVGTISTPADTIAEFTTPAEFRVERSQYYKLVATALESGTEVEIQAVAPKGYAYNGNAGSARGWGPMVSFPRYEGSTHTFPRMPPPSLADPRDPNSRVMPISASEMRSDLQPGHIRVESVDGRSVQVRMLYGGPGARTVSGVDPKPAGSGFILGTPVDVATKPEGDFVITFEPVDTTVKLSARVKGVSPMDDGAAGGGSIMVCRAFHYSEITGGTTSKIPSKVTCADDRR
ncbi:MAG TPA: M56 family metallopeptidase [Gemmatimonadaceae bacterium]|nr:M56 family metallopeptidase [Gemmatimonadaceae bacterium]